MWMGFWPPSKFTRFLAPERAPRPLWPRPEVLPTPEPSPRPTRLRSLREPGAGERLWSPIRSSAIVDLDQVSDGADEAAHRRVVGGTLRGLADPAQPECPQRLLLPAARAIGGANLLQLERARHQAGVSSGGAGVSSGAGSSALGSERWESR